MIFIKSFLVGGAICAIVQIFIDKTKLTPGRLMVSLVCIGVVLGAVGIYEPFSKWAGCGATVPFVAEPLHIHFAYGQRGFFKGSVFLQNTAVFGEDMML